MSDDYRVLTDDQLQARLLPYIKRMGLGGAIPNYVGNLHAAWRLPELTRAVLFYAAVSHLSYELIIRALFDLPPQQTARLLCEIWLNYQESKG